MRRLQFVTISNNIDHGFKTISDIGKERIRLADEKINQHSPKGFKSFQLKDYRE